MQSGIVKAPWTGFVCICDHNGFSPLAAELSFLSFDNLLPGAVHWIRTLAPSEIGSTGVVHLWAESRPEQYLALQTYLSDLGMLVSRFSLAIGNCQSFEITSLPS